MSHDITERAFVGALLHLPPVDVVALAGMVKLDDLDEPRHRVIVALAVELAAVGTRPDPAQVHALARTSGRVQAIDMPALSGLLVDLLTECPVPVSAPAYARAVVEASVRRRVTMAATRLANVADDGSLDALAHVVTSEAAALSDAMARLTRMAPTMTGAAA